jgi:hypothetical protein
MWFIFAMGTVTFTGSDPELSPSASTAKTV